MSSQMAYNHQSSSLHFQPYGHKSDSSSYLTSTMTIGGKSFTTVYKQAQSTAIPPRSSTPKFMDYDNQHIPWQLPSPVSDETPPSWKEWETNANWPHPAKSTMQSKSRTPRPPSRAELDANSNWPHPASAIHATKSSPNANWPHPAAPAGPTLITPAPVETSAPSSRRRTTSSSSARAPTQPIYAPPAVSRELSNRQNAADRAWYQQNHGHQHQSQQQQQQQQSQRQTQQQHYSSHYQQRELPQQKWEQPQQQWEQPQQQRPKRSSGILKKSEPDKPVVPPLPPQTQAQTQSRADRPLRFPSAPTQTRPSATAPAPVSIAPKVTVFNPLLARGTQQLRFDLRLPYTHARKAIRGSHWTHLSHSDLMQPATEPPVSRLRMFIPAIEVHEWCIEIDTRRRSFSGAATCVTVDDVLRKIAELLSQPLSTNRWARDSINPAKAERVSRAYERRVEKLRRNTSPTADPTSAGILRVDYLGSQYIFQGLSLQHGQEKSEWARLDVGPDVQR